MAAPKSGTGGELKDWNKGLKNKWQQRRNDEYKVAESDTNKAEKIRGPGHLDTALFTGIPKKPEDEAMMTVPGTSAYYMGLKEQEDSSFEHVEDMGPLAHSFSDPGWLMGTCDLAETFGELYIKRIPKSESDTHDFYRFESGHTSRYDGAITYKWSILYSPSVNTRAAPAKSNEGRFKLKTGNKPKDDEKNCDVLFQKDGVYALRCQYSHPGITYRVRSVGIVLFRQNGVLQGETMIKTRA